MYKVKIKYYYDNRQEVMDVILRNSPQIIKHRKCWNDFWEEIIFCVEEADLNLALSTLNSVASGHGIQVVYTRKLKERKNNGS